MASNSWLEFGRGAFFGGGSNANMLNSRRTAALGVPGFERVQFTGMAKEEKDGSFTVQPSYFPQ
jgi:hypothetical protein